MKRLMGGVFILTAVLSISLLWAASDVDAGGSIVDYSEIVYNARYFGMGGTGAAFGNDSGVVQLNPALLGRMMDWEFSSTQTKISNEFTYTFLNAVFPLEGEGFGLSYMYMDPGKIIGSDSLNLYGQPVEGDLLKAYSQMLSLSYGRRVFRDNLFAGITLKTISKKLDTVTGQGNAVDFGFLTQIGDRSNFSLSAKNLFQTGFTYSNTEDLTETFNSEIILGFSSKFYKDKIIFSVEEHIDEVNDTNFGVEYLNDTLAFRMGLMDGHVTFGTGLRYDLIQLDVGYKYNNFPMENQIYVSVTLGNARERLLSKPDISLVQEEGGILE